MAIFVYICIYFSLFSLFSLRDDKMRMSHNHVWHKFLSIFKKVDLVKRFFGDTLSIEIKEANRQTVKHIQKYPSNGNKNCDLTLSWRHKKTSYHLDSQTEIIFVSWGTKITFKNVICLPKGILFISSVMSCMSY